jgi:periplasmic protein TonB
VLIYAPPVVYPAIAKQAHVSGTVVIEGVIDDKGNVTQVKAISGPALLVPAALRACRSESTSRHFWAASPYPFTST